MAEELQVKTTIAPIKGPAPTVLHTAKDAYEHLGKCADVVIQYAGKRGYNPYLYIAEKLEPLKNILDFERKDTALINATIAKAMALPLPTEEDAKVDTGGNSPLFALSAETVRGTNDKVIPSGLPVK